MIKKEMKYFDVFSAGNIVIKRKHLNSGGTALYVATHTHFIFTSSGKKDETYAL